MTNHISSVQKVWVDKVFKLFVKGDLSEFDIAVTEKFQPFDTNNEKQKETTQLFAAIVCSLRKDVALPVTSLEDYLNELVTLALGSSNSTQVTSAARMIGSLVNKWKDSKLPHLLVFFSFFLTAA